MSFCRITGHARNLPKPNFFPLIPPISPADARKLCRITGKSQSMEDHNYIPVMDMLMEKGKNHCSVVRRSSLNLQSHHYTPSFMDNQSSQVSGCRITQKHQAMAGYQYVYPMLDFDTMNNKEQEELRKIIDAQEQENSNKKFVYTLHEEQFGLVLPTTLEQALRKGDIENLMLSKDGVKLMVQVKQGMAVTIPMKTMTQDEMEQDLQQEQLMEGQGPDEEVIRSRPRKKPKQYLNRKISDSILDHRRRLFEQNEEKVLKEEIAKEKIVEKQKVMRKQSIAKRKESVIEPPKLSAIVEMTSPQSSDILIDGPHFPSSSENENIALKRSENESNNKTNTPTNFQENQDSKAIKEEANMKLSEQNITENHSVNAKTANTNISLISEEEAMLEEQKLHVMRGFMNGDLSSTSLKADVQNANNKTGAEGDIRKEGELANGFLESNHKITENGTHNSILANTMKTTVDGKQIYSRQYYLSNQPDEDGIILANNCNSGGQMGKTILNGFNEHGITKIPVHGELDSNKKQVSEMNGVESGMHNGEVTLLKGTTQMDPESESMHSLNKQSVVGSQKQGSKFTDTENGEVKCGKVSNNQLEDNIPLSEKTRRPSSKEKRLHRKLRGANEENNGLAEHGSERAGIQTRLSSLNRSTSEELDELTSSDDTDSELRGSSKKRGSILKNTYDYHKKKLNKYELDEEHQHNPSLPHPDSFSIDDSKRGVKQEGHQNLYLSLNDSLPIDGTNKDTKPDSQQNTCLSLLDPLPSDASKKDMRLESQQNPWLPLPDPPSIDNSEKAIKRESVEYEALPNKWIVSMEHRLKALVSSKDGVSPSTNMNEWMSRLESLSLLPDGNGQKPALLILTQKAKMVVPVEARRDVLLGKQSYFLITDNGIQFYPSEASMELRPWKNKHTTMNGISPEEFSENISQKIPLTMDEEFDEIKHLERKRVSPVLPKQSHPSECLHSLSASPSNTTDDDNAEGFFTPKTDETDEDFQMSKENNEFQSEWICSLQEKLQNLLSTQTDQVTKSQDLLQAWYDSIGCEDDKPALLITKHSLHMVVPIEARRDVVMGKRSYFLVDDRGIKFFPADPQFSSAYSSAVSSLEPSRRSSIARQIPSYLRADRRSASRSMSRDRFDDKSESPGRYSRDSSIDRFVNTRHQISAKHSPKHNHYDRRIATMIFGEDFYSSVPSYATTRRPHVKRLSNYY